MHAMNMRPTLLMSPNAAIDPAVELGEMADAPRSVASMLRRQATADQRRAANYRNMASASPSVAAPSASRRACALDLKATVLSLAADGLDPLQPAST